MTQRLARASTACDWTKLESLDRELGRMLPQLLAQGDWSQTEQAALQKLRQAHECAYEQCQREVTRLEQRMSEMRERQDGWLAYALNDELGSKAQ